jgi:hydroxyacylglutathione hydrolase
MIFRQILHPATGCASYLFGCTSKGALAVVDPHIEHVGEYLLLAEQARSPIVAIFETHVQADHLSGALLLAEQTGAPVHLHEAADVEFPHRTVREGDEIQLGNDYVRVLHTPGHSPDSISLIVGDRMRGGAPWFSS